MTKLLKFIADNLFYSGNLICPSGWNLFNSSCYLGIKTDFILNHTMAEQICRKEHINSHLPSVHSLAEITFLVKLGLKHGWFGYKRGVYLGGKLVEGKVIWTDGSQTDFNFWREGFYHFSHNSCLAIFSTLLWQEISCQVDSKRFVFMEDFTICRTKMNQSGLYLVLNLWK